MSTCSTDEQSPPQKTFPSITALPYTKEGDIENVKLPMISSGTSNHTSSSKEFGENDFF